MHFGRRGGADRLILQVELSNELAVVGRVHGLPADEELYLGVRGVGLYPVEDAPPHRADGVVGVGPDVQVVHLATLVRETHDQRDVLPSESPGGRENHGVGAGLKLPNTADSLYTPFIYNDNTATRSRPDR